jgi:hypothetical protein
MSILLLEWRSAGRHAAGGSGSETQMAFLGHDHGVAGAVEQIAAGSVDADRQ